MAKIIGNTTATPNPRPDWNQTDDKKADYIKNKPVILTEENIVDLIDTYGNAAPIRSDWEQSDETKLDYIKNKPVVLTEQEIIDLIGEHGNDAQIQVDWAQTDEDQVDYIKNKPVVLTEQNVIDLIDEHGNEAQIQSDWLQDDTESLDYIKNKPLLGNIAAKDKIDRTDLVATVQASLKKADNAIPLAQKGTANGVAELNENGKVPATQLPSYVDDVAEYPNLESFPEKGDADKIYVSLDTNTTYRWGGTSYVPMISGVVLGETEATAYRGDRGKIAYEHTLITGNPHNVTAELIGALPAINGKAAQGTTSTDDTLKNMNRFQSDVYIQGDGGAPNNPRVAGFYMGKSATDENRHIDIVSGAKYSYIDFNKANAEVDYNARLIVDVENGATEFKWGDDSTQKTFNIQGAIQQGGQSVALKGDIPDVSNCVRYTTNENVSIAGATKPTYTFVPPEGDNQPGNSKAAAYFPEGIIMGGTAQSAGFMVRGICGINSSDPKTGACTKDNLYINYDGNNDYKYDRQLVMQAGAVGTHYGNNVYQYAAVRGDALKGYCDANYVNVTGDTMTGALKMVASNPHIGFKDSGYDTEWHIQAHQDQFGFGPTWDKAIKSDKNGNLTASGSVKIGNAVTLEYDSTNECLNFSFK
jgi:hypothetical protein